jgi:hypothetical protein
MTDPFRLVGLITIVLAYPAMMIRWFKYACDKEDRPLYLAGLIVTILGALVIVQTFIKDPWVQVYGSLIMGLLYILAQMYIYTVPNPYVEE